MNTPTYHKGRHVDEGCVRELLLQHYEAKRAGDRECAQTLACKARKVARRTGRVQGDLSLTEWLSVYRQAFA